MEDLGDRRSVPSYSSKAPLWDILIHEEHVKHPHCYNCINRKCKAKPPICPMEVCDLGCGAQYHACKRTEHALLCANAHVACINHQYGCPVKMLRHRQAAHLERCVASVVVCSIEWGRIPKPAHEVVPLLAEKLDTIMAFRDQKYLEGAMFPSGNQSWHSMYSLQGKIARCIEAHNERMTRLQDGLAENPNPSQPWPLFLQPTIEFGTRYHSCVEDKYVFICGEEMRRDMYCWHFKNVHTDILCGLNGWLDHHCPLQSLNCTFSERRLYPDIPSARVTYNRLMECFAVTYDTYEHKEESACVSMKQNIVNLPTEVLELVFSYLDPLSLANVSLTCKHLRHLCSSIFLPRQGIVRLVWEKEEKLVDLSEMWPTPHWNVVAHSWKFPKFFTPVKKWGYHDYSPMSHHMRECGKYKRFSTRLPYNLTVRIPNWVHLEEPSDMDTCTAPSSADMCAQSHMEACTSPVPSSSAQTSAIAPVAQQLDMETSTSAVSSSSDPCTQTSASVPEAQQLD